MAARTVGETAAVQEMWRLWMQTGRIPCPVLYVMSGWTSSSTIGWCEPVHISSTAAVSFLTQGYSVPRGGIGVPMDTVASMMVGFDTSVVPARVVRGMAAALKLKRPVFVSCVVIAIQESTNRPFMPIGVLVTPDNLPRDWGEHHGLRTPPGLLSGRDFTGITSPVAYNTIPCPWTSVIAAVKWANKEFAVAITPWVFCMLATLLWMEDPVVHRPVHEDDLPWELLHYVPYPVVEALAVRHWLPWSVVYRFELGQCRVLQHVSIYQPITLMPEAP